MNSNLDRPSPYWHAIDELLKHEFDVDLTYYGAIIHDKRFLICNYCMKTDDKLLIDVDYYLRGNQKCQMDCSDPCFIEKLRQLCSDQISIIGYNVSITPYYHNNILVCLPYSLANLHVIARSFKIPINCYKDGHYIISRRKLQLVHNCAKPVGKFDDIQRIKDGVFNK